MKQITPAITPAHVKRQVERRNGDAAFKEAEETSAFGLLGLATGKIEEAEACYRRAAAHDALQSLNSLRAPPANRPSDGCAARFFRCLPHSLGRCFKAIVEEQPTMAPPANTKSRRQQKARVQNIAADLQCERARRNSQHNEGTQKLSGKEQVWKGMHSPLPLYPRTTGSSDMERESHRKRSFGGGLQDSEPASIPPLATREAKRSSLTGQGASSPPPSFRYSRAQDTKRNSQGVSAWLDNGPFSLSEQNVHSKSATTSASANSPRPSRNRARYGTSQNSNLTVDSSYHSPHRSPQSSFKVPPLNDYAAAASGSLREGTTRESKTRARPRTRDRNLNAAHPTQKRTLTGRARNRSPAVEADEHSRALAAAGASSPPPASYSPIASVPPAGNQDMGAKHRASFKYVVFKAQQRAWKGAPGIAERTR